jgi:hypothetical protein
MYYIIMPDLQGKEYFRVWGSNGKINMAKHFTFEEANDITNNHEHWSSYKVDDNGVRTIVHQGIRMRRIMYDYPQTEVPF